MNKVYQRLNTFKVPKGFRGKSAVYTQLWWFTQSILFKTSPQVMYRWRVFLLRIFGASIGKGCIIRPSVTVTYPWNVEIGDYTWIGDDVVLYSLGKINIGKNVVVSQRSYLCGGGHDYTEPSFPIFKKNIKLEDECWLATDVFVGPGVEIGFGAVVGARSTVLKSIPGGNVYAGNPLRVIKER